MICSVSMSFRLFSGSASLFVPARDISSANRSLGPTVLIVQNLALAGKILVHFPQLCIYFSFDNSVGFFVDGFARSDGYDIDDLL